MYRIVYPHACENAGYELPFDASGYRMFSRSADAVNAIAGLSADKDIVVCILAYEFSAYAIFKALSKFRIKYGAFVANALPIGTEGGGSIKNLLYRITPEKIFRTIMRLNARRIAAHIFLKIRPGFLGISPASFLLAGGERSVNSGDYPVASSTEVIWMHTLDYDIYLEQRAMTVSPGERTAVFLDEYLPFHPDFKYFGVKPYVEPDGYYEALRRFFSRIEEKYKWRVVIAAHPRSDYDKRPDYFGGRQVVRGRSIEMIRKAACVIAHSSTAVNFAVLFEKPVIFVTTKDLDASPEGAWTDNMAKALGKKAHDLDKDMDIDPALDLTVDIAQYNKYSNDYIKKAGTKDLPFWQIFADRIKEI